MGTCNCRSSSSKKPKIHYSLQIRPNGNRISTQILAEFKKGLEINHSYLELSSSAQYDFKSRNQDDKDCLTAEIIRDPKTKQEVLEIKQALLNHFLFRGLSDDIIEQLIQDMVCYQLEKNHFVFKQGDPGYNFFIVSSGLVAVFVDSVKCKTLERSQAFGEIALLHNTERKATVKAITRVRLWGLGRDSFKRIVSIGNQRHALEIKNFLNSVNFFTSLTSEQIDLLLSSLSVQNFNSGEMIIKESEDKPEFYIIKEGKVLIYYKSENLAYLGKGEYFGEQSLIYHSTRKASAKALDDTVLLMITKDSLLHILGGNLETVLFNNTIKIAFSQDPIFSQLSNSQVNKLTEKIEIKEIKGSRTRYPTEEMWIVIKGEVEEEGEMYKLYSCLNSRALLNQQIYSTETSSDGATIGVLSRKSLESAIPIGIQRQIEINEVYRNLKNIFIFSLISDSILEKLAGVVKLSTSAEGEIIFNENDSGDEFFIIKSGEVDVIKGDTKIRKLCKNDYFGERALLYDEPRSATIISSTCCELWKITRSTFELIVDSNLRQYLIKKSKLETEKFPLADLTFIRYVGKGSYSKVLLVRNEKLEMNYVLKIIEIETIQKHNIMRRLIEEKKTHSQLNFQFIPTLVNTYKNDHAVCFLCEYFPGPSLLSLIRDFGGIQLKLVQFYTSAILLTLKYLHSKSVIHRGISPENIIIDSSGYPILVEQHQTKQISDRTFTILGVTHYMSPEMIRGKGYSFPSDFWSLGILVYEMIFTFVPFVSTIEDPYIIYKSILEDELKYPVFTKRNMKINGLLDQLLSKNPGTRGNIESIMKHSWFEGTSWDSILSKRITPDYVHNIQEKKQDSNEFSGIFYECAPDWAEGF